MAVTKEFIESLANDGFVVSEDGVLTECHLKDKKIVIPEGVTGIGEAVFQLRDSLKEVILPKSLTSIGDYAFADCPSLKKIVVPETVTEIGESAFSSCTSLKEITILCNLKSIDPTILFNCPSLEKVRVTEKVAPLFDDIFLLCPVEILPNGKKENLDKNNNSDEPDQKMADTLFDEGNYEEALPSLSKAF